MPTFVYAVVGDAAVAQVNLSLAFLKRFTRHDILVVVGRSSVEVAHDQVVRASPPAGLSNHAASIVVKTGLHRLVGGPGQVACYLDSDVVATSRDVDAVFTQPRGPVAFAPDHVHLERFSRWAVRCGCTSDACDHLRRAIHETFGVTITDPRWQHWNGGVFVFDDRSAPLFERWNTYCLLAMEDPRWIVRDQGTLAAAAWSLGWHGLPTLPTRFNTIVDRFAGVAPARRPALTPREFARRDHYRLGPAGPAFLHFINGGMGQRGWKNWDDAAALLPASARRRMALPA